MAESLHITAQRNKLGIEECTTTPFECVQKVLPTLLANIIVYITSQYRTLISFSSLSS